MINIPCYNQGDPKWSQDKMGSSGKTLSSDGCLVTCLSMALANFAINVNPGELCTLINSLNGFDEYGNLYLEAISKKYSSVSLIGSYETSLSKRPQYTKIEIGEAIHRIQRLIHLGIPVALNVDAIGHDGLADHFVLAYDCVGTNDFQINDPISGKSVKLSSKYDFADKAIYRYIAWIGAPISFPNADNGGLPSEGVTAWKLSQAIKGISRDLYTREAFENLILS